MNIRQTYNTTIIAVGVPGLDGNLSAADQQVTDRCILMSTTHCNFVGIEQHRQPSDHTQFIK
jgi:hypothetical protein